MKKSGKRKANTNNWVGSRQLLRHIRDIMANQENPQSRLNNIVEIIAHDMLSEVCSIYIKRAGDVLELFATHGLHSTAIHKTRLRIGEGIVGDIAANAISTKIEDAQTHPSFAYRPETGEERYKSMLGVPILRGGRVFGVLVVQNKTKRLYLEEEVEALETVGMVIAEMIAAGGIISRHEQTPTDGIATKPLRIDGVSLSKGLAIGRAILHRPQVPVGKMVSEGDVNFELARLDTAVTEMHDKLDVMLKIIDTEDSGDHVDILESYRMIAKDRGWVKRIGEAIKTGLSAEGAVVKIQNDTRNKMNKIQDVYLRERLLDLEDIAYRLLQHLSHNSDDTNDIKNNLPKDVILIARNMGPAELLDYDSKSLRGVILEEGSATSHVAIIARALDIPVIGRIKRILNRVEPYDRIVVDGNNGVCFIRPGEEFRRVFAKSMQLHAKKLKAYARDKDLPSTTIDGVKIDLQINAGLLIDLPHLHQTGATGIGLYRTEVPFMMRDSFPDVKTQIKLYQRIFKQIDDKDISFRTLDIGGDKTLPYLDNFNEENPAMGWRAIRVALDRPAILCQQLRAIIYAANGRHVKIMFPMITDVSEFIAAKNILSTELKRAKSRGKAIPKNIHIGAMLEVPSLAFQLPALLPHTDFISIGTNDLLQFFFASDRGNARMNNRYDSLSPAFLCILKDIISKCNDYKKPVNICGEMAGDPLQAMALLAIGAKTLSMSAASIGPVRHMIRTLNLQRTASYINSLLQSPAHSLRNDILAFAKDHKMQF